MAVSTNLFISVSFHSIAFCQQSLALCLFKLQYTMEILDKFN